MIKLIHISQSANSVGTDINYSEVVYYIVTHHSAIPEHDDQKKLGDEACGCGRT